MSTFRIRFEFYVSYPLADSWTKLCLASSCSRRPTTLCHQRRTVNEPDARLGHHAKWSSFRPPTTHRQQQQQTKVVLGRKLSAVAFQHFKIYRKIKALSLFISTLCGELCLNAHLAPNVAEIVPPRENGPQNKKMDAKATASSYLRCVRTQPDVMVEWMIAGGETNWCSSRIYLRLLTWPGLGVDVN